VAGSFNRFASIALAFQFKLKLCSNFKHGSYTDLHPGFSLLEKSNAWLATEEGVSK